MRLSALERLYETHAAGLFAFLVYRTGDRSLAEDVLADTFERAVRGRRRFDPRKGSERSWLYSIAINRLHDVYRRRSLEAQALDRVAELSERPPAFEDGVDLREDLRLALAKLSKEEREAIALRFGGDLTVPEIAKLLNEPLSRIEGRVYRGLRKLREMQLA